MLKTYNPASITSSRSNYSHAVEVPPNARTLYISGQVPVAADGSTPEAIEEQVVLAFDNVQTVLAEAGMSLDDVVRVNVYLTDKNYFPAFRTHRNKLFTEAQGRRHSGRGRRAGPPAVQGRNRSRRGKGRLI